MPDALFDGLRDFLSEKERQGHSCRLVRQAEPDEALPTEPASLATDVFHVEGDRLRVRPTGFDPAAHSSLSEFRFFLDGVQYSHLIGFVDNIPLVHHLSAAVILQRDPESRHLRVWDCTGAEECVLVPFRYLPQEEMARFGIPVQDTTDRDTGGATPMETLALRALAHSKCQRIRRYQEVELIQKWAAAGESGWLMVDGPLMLLPTLRSRAPMVGVIKSFGAQFFTGEDQVRVMSLPVGHRSTAFQLPRGSAPPEDAADQGARRWFSWYVRTRDPQSHDWDFGLLRVETPPDPAMLGAADEISRWLISERTPLSTPDPRWANLLYPIRACERYLRSTLPQRRRVHLMLRQ